MFEFVVADHGIGALASLRSNPEFAELANSRDALPRVLQMGCTSTGDPERGRGFDVLFRGLANHNGDPVMRPSSATGKARPGTTAPGLGILKPSASRASRARGSKHWRGRLPCQNTAGLQSGRVPRAISACRALATMSACNVDPQCSDSADQNRSWKA